MVNILNSFSEGLFVIRGCILKREYTIIVYKYQKDYFLLKNMYLYDLLLDSTRDITKDEDYILDIVEKTFEDNCYCKIDKSWVVLDLNTLVFLNDVLIKYFSFDK